VALRLPGQENHMPAWTNGRRAIHCEVAKLCQIQKMN
jgi:hypothetical protein